MNCVSGAAIGNHLKNFNNDFNNNKIGFWRLRGVFWNARQNRIPKFRQSPQQLFKVSNSGHVRHMRPGGSKLCRGISLLWDQIKKTHWLYLAKTRWGIWWPPGSIRSESSSTACWTCSSQTAGFRSIQWSPLLESDTVTASKTESNKTRYKFLLETSQLLKFINQIIIQIKIIELAFTSLATALVGVIGFGAFKYLNKSL